jgi:hypothetical protein
VPETARDSDISHSATSFWWTIWHRH